MAKSPLILHRFYDGEKSEKTLITELKLPPGSLNKTEHLFIGKERYRITGISHELVLPTIHQDQEVEAGHLITDVVLNYHPSTLLRAKS